MKTLIFILMACSLLLSSDKYYLVDEYYKANPSGKPAFNAFSDLVSDIKIQKLKKKQSKPLKIYMVYPGDQISDYWRRSKDSFEKRMKEIGVEYELYDHFTKPSIEVSKQAKVLFEALSNDTDYLIFTLDVNKHYKFISNLLFRKKPKLLLQNITTPLKSFRQNQPFLYVGFDHATGSKVLAEQYIKEVGTNGNYAVLYGTKGYVSYMRGDTFIDHMSKNTNLKMVASYYTDFNKEKSKQATYDLLKNNKDLKFIYACSTDTALGAIEVLKEKNLLGKIKVNGWGGGSSELESIEKGEMDFTVMRMNDDNGVAMAEAIKLDISSKTKDVPLIYSGEFKLVKKGISDKELEVLKNRAFRYSK